MCRGLESTYWYELDVDGSCGWWTRTIVAGLVLFARVKWREMVGVPQASNIRAKPGLKV